MLMMADELMGMMAYRQDGIEARWPIGVMAEILEI